MTHVAVLFAVVGTIRLCQWFCARVWHSLVVIVWACLGCCVLLSSVLLLFCSVVRGRRSAAGLLSKSYFVGMLTERRASDGCLQHEFDPAAPDL